MKLDVSNPNYAATVVSARNLVPVEGLDNLVALPVFGYQALVSKDTVPGTLGVVFPAECQVSHEYASENGLYRHMNLNKDPSAQGYLEDNRRVKALKLRGARSDALFMPIESLSYLTLLDRSDTSLRDLASLKEGDEFTSIDGHEVCAKYVVVRHGQGTGGRQTPRHAARVDEKVFPRQFDVTNLFKVTLPPETWVTVTQKLHGTSLRVANVPVPRKLKWYEKAAVGLGIKVQDHEYTMMYGSRTVVKDANDPAQKHYYDEDIWAEVGHRLDGLVPEGVQVYGEIVGFTSAGAPIQPKYTYDCRPETRERKLYVYRVTTQVGRGVPCDLGWDALKGFCQARGLEHVPELWRGKVSDLHVEEYLDTTFYPRYPQAVPLSTDSPCDEGVVLRVEGWTPDLYKAKSAEFLRLETKQLDANVVDTESMS